MIAGFAHQCAGCVKELGRSRRARLVHSSPLGADPVARCVKVQVVGGDSPIHPVTVPVGLHDQWVNVHVTDLSPNTEYTVNSVSEVEDPTLQRDIPWSDATHTCTLSPPGQPLVPEVVPLSQRPTRVVLRVHNPSGGEAVDGPGRDPAPTHMELSRLGPHGSGPVVTLHPVAVGVQWLEVTVENLVPGGRYAFSARAHVADPDLAALCGDLPSSDALDVVMPTVVQVCSALGRLACLGCGWLPCIRVLGEGIGRVVAVSRHCASSHARQWVSFFHYPCDVLRSWNS
jgi:hypothetical protein